MLKYCFILCFITSVACGQGVIKGRVYENKTRVALTGIQVLDLNNRQQTLTDNSGTYSITAKPGDRLVFSGFSYQTDTVVIADQREREVLLTPKQNMLSSVTVNSNYTNAPTTFKHYDPDFHGQTVVYQRDNNGNYKGGIAFRIPDSRAGENKREQEAKRVADDAIRDKIEVVFIPENIGKYVPLKSDELKGFIELYRPNVDIYTAKDFNLTNYLNDCYKQFVKLPADKRHLVKLEK